MDELAPLHEASRHACPNAIGHARRDLPGVSLLQPLTHFQARGRLRLPPLENSGNLSITAQMRTSPMYAWWPSKKRLFMKVTSASSQSRDVVSGRLFASV